MQGSSYNITRSFYLLIYFIIQNCCQQYVKLQKLLKPLEPKKTLELLKPPGPPKLKKLLELLKLLELCYQPRNKATRTEATVLGKGNSVWKKTVFWAIISFFFIPPSSRGIYEYRMHSLYTETFLGKENISEKFHT